ncbi:MAG TPA: helicase HerA-like domain-containing protein [Methylomirabilota bacterium]|jgi:DNA helicase HerA-like ATPase|nr:helicase HerA-like domain-containing protein [Methylomirabilota bacterium]
MTDGIFIGRAEDAPQALALKYANRHGLIAGATGTGKTVSLQVLAEGFSAMGVPVFMADVKGDLSGVSQAGGGNPRLEERAKLIGLEPYEHRGFPTVYWDLFAEQGHPIRATVTEMGPLLLARLLELNDVQAGVLAAGFKFADDQGLLLLDLKDLRALLAHLGENAQSLMSAYGNISKASVGAIQRQLLVLEGQGGEHFFGEPALELSDFMRTEPGGMGLINLLAADRLVNSPRLYATFLLWLLSELFEELPEAGDVEKPKLVFFFDEAHLLFEEAPKPLLEKIEQVVRLIRSKGVGVYFITQNPLDIPDEVLGQLGNRIQHALRAFTPRDQRAVRAAAETFRPNPKLNVERVITELAVGEALVSTLGQGGVPSMVERTLIRPPAARVGPASPHERQAAIAASPVAGRYDKAVDRNSAYEQLAKRAGAAAERQTPVADDRRGPWSEPAEERRTPARRQTRASSRRDSVGTSMAKSVVRSVGSAIGRELVRGILGSLRRSGRR